MKIIPLSEGAFTVDASKKFIPFHLDNDTMSSRNQGSLLVEIQPFLIVKDDDVILLDTGLGLTDSDGQMQLCKNLRKHGFDANDVTRVIMSHLHKDHAGGLFNPDTNKLSFEEAVYHIQKQELEYALEKGSPSYQIEQLERIKESGNIVLEEAEQGIIAEGIRYEVTGAHAKFHRVIWLQKNDETVFFGADDAPQLSQMKTRFAAKYDYNGKKAMHLREKWLEEGNNWQFLFYHDIQTPVFRTSFT